MHFAKKHTRSHTYVSADLGITEDLFDERLFNSPRVKGYFENRLKGGDNHHAWLAINSLNEIVGCVATERTNDHCEMASFYVRNDLKGHGIGHSLYEKVLEYAGNLPIQVDVVEYMQETIDMYKHWGFSIDESKGKLIYDIPEWPESALIAYHAIYMTKPGL